LNAAADEASIEEVDVDVGGASVTTGEEAVSKAVGDTEVNSIVDVADSAKGGEIVDVLE